MYFLKEFLERLSTRNTFILFCNLDTQFCPTHPPTQALHTYYFIATYLLVQ